MQRMQDPAPSCVPAFDMTSSTTSRQGAGRQLQPTYTTRTFRVKTQFPSHPSLTGLLSLPTSCRSSLQALTSPKGPGKEGLSPSRHVLPPPRRAGRWCCRVLTSSSLKVLVPKPGPWGLVVLVAWFKPAPQSLTHPKALIWLRSPWEHP